MDSVEALANYVYYAELYQETYSKQWSRLVKLAEQSSDWGPVEVSSPAQAVVRAENTPLSDRNYVTNLKKIKSKAGGQVDDRAEDKADLGHCPG